MIYHVTRDGDPNVVTVNADTAQGAARIAAERHVGWEGVELWVYDLRNRAWPVVYGAVA
jgi:hypothetical protein